jgi:hypothetical protein
MLGSHIRIGSLDGYLQLIYLLNLLYMSYFFLIYPYIL